MRNDFSQNRYGDDRYRDSAEHPGERWATDPRRGPQGPQGSPDYRQNPEWQPGTSRSGFSGSEYRGQSSYGGLSEHGSRGYEPRARGFGGAGEYESSEHGQGGRRGYVDYGQGNYGGSEGDAERGGLSAYGMSGGSRYSQENEPYRGSSGYGTSGEYRGGEEAGYGQRQGTGAAHVPGYGGSGQSQGPRRADGDPYRGSFSDRDERDRQGYGATGSARGQGYGSLEGYAGSGVPAGQGGTAYRSPSYGGYGNQSYGAQGYGAYGNEGYGRSAEGNAYQGRYQGRYQGGYEPSSPRRGQLPRGYARSDERLREDVCERLAHRHDLDISDVSVNVHGGQVVLEGSVPERHMKHAIEDVADAVMGVREVDNRVRVKRNWDHEGSAASTSSSAGASGSSTTSGASNTGGVTGAFLGASGGTAGGNSASASTDPSTSESSRNGKSK